MDACFISSSSTMNAPLVRARLVPTYPSNNIVKYPIGKSKNPFSVTCSQSGPAPISPSPRDEAASPVLTADWRAFRARLVAREQAVPAQDGLSLSSLMNPAAAGNSPADKWAHPIHEPEKGCLLIATEKLDGVDVFERTVILLLSTGPVGPTGLVLNRQSVMSIKEMRSSPLDVSGAISDRPLFSGGPMENSLFLVSPDEEGKAYVERSGMFQEVMTGLYSGTAESARCAAEMVERDQIRVSDLRFFEGFCAWEGAQLMEDIRAGYWALAACSPSVVGLTSEGRIGLWEEITALLSPNKVC
ncbi:uncharacterized protein LOC127241856 [Andrographis paniculata]|uniref:uncharacterized protein LOC127241856 n=1 Tax=Andrographis paniculata TaxID=175694 RepID=UPI0021E89BF4|nr:uncharacterized protein LOC127241856 [Andrographis paniculata]